MLGSRRLHLAPCVLKHGQIPNLLSSGNAPRYNSRDSIWFFLQCIQDYVNDGADGCYDIPGHGKLVYAGLQGWWSLLKDIIPENNLAHPLCQHLRDGQWALDYIVGRLERAAKKPGQEALKKPADWFKERFDALRQIPSFLLPRYFGLLLRTSYMAACERGIE
ncbi:hypothetical protein BN1708_017354, partial [Verticillium longisporum]